jgi:hypothetical protein
VGMGSASGLGAALNDGHAKPWAASRLARRTAGDPGARARLAAAVPVELLLLSGERQCFDGARCLSCVHGERAGGNGQWARSAPRAHAPPETPSHTAREQRALDNAVRAYTVYNMNALLQPDAHKCPS